MPVPSPSSDPSIADRVRSILASRGLTLAEVSRSSRVLVPHDSRLHVPHNFLSSLRATHFSPSLYHLLALSVLSGYPLVDWLAVFGLSFDDASRCQARLTALRTACLDTRIYQPRSSIPWFRDLREADLASSLVPLSQWLVGGVERSFESLPPGMAEDYLYVKIGLQDALAFPDLLPGSIVRIDCRLRTLEQSPIQEPASGTVYLIKHSRGLVCSRLSRPGPKTIVLCASQLPYAAVELREGSQAKILGVADLEIRPTRNLQVPVVPRALGRFWTPPPLPPSPPMGNVGQFLRDCRLKSGLSFRQASERTSTVAEVLGDARYYCSPGALSDYETRKLPPRRIHKTISIAAAYFANIGDFLEQACVGLFRGDQHPIPGPDRVLERLAGDQ